MRRWTARTIVALVATACAPPCSAEQADSLAQWFGHGTLSANFRLRYEGVDQSNALRDARALTLSTRLGFETAELAGVSVKVEGEDVRALQEEYNSASNGRSQFSTVADPQGSEFNQGYVNIQRGATLARIGRQRVVIDNARFFGDVAWRQNHQTYDAAMFMHRLGGHRLQYAYMWKAHRFLGDDHPLGNLKMRTHSLNYTYQALDGNRVYAYAHLLDMRNQPVRARNTRSLGLRMSGGLGKRSKRLLYHLEYADQAGYADGADSNDAHYARADVGIKFANEWTATAGFEQLDGDGIYAFQTQLATLHIFNGFADVFAGGTPATGLRDRYLKLYAPLRGARLDLIYHQFDATSGGASYGEEWDLILAAKLSRRYEIGAGIADYRADQFGVDTRKIWAWFTVSLESR